MSILVSFIRESNIISGLHHDPTRSEIRAHDEFISSRACSPDLLRFVSTISTHNLRSGTRRNLCRLLDQTATLSPYRVHCLYRYLHPFDGCNGRSSRVLWLWMMYRHSSESRLTALRDGFLRGFYLQSQANFTPRARYDSSDDYSFRPDGNYKKFPCLCGGEFGRVLSSRPQPEGFVKRRRACNRCDRRVTTLEKAIGETLISGS